MFKISVCIFGDGVGEGDKALCARLERVLAFLAETGVHEVLLPFDDALARIALLATEKLRDRYEIVCSGACMAHSPQCRAVKRGGRETHLYCPAFTFFLRVGCNVPDR